MNGRSSTARRRVVGERAPTFQTQGYDGRHYQGRETPLLLSEARRETPGQTGFGSKACAKEDSQGRGSSCPKEIRCCQVADCCFAGPQFPHVRTVPTFAKKAVHAHNLMNELERWANFYLTMSAAAATLLGLMFVVITLAAERRLGGAAKIPLSPYTDTYLFCFCTIPCRTSDLPESYSTHRHSLHLPRRCRGLTLLGDWFNWRR